MNHQESGDSKAKSSRKLSSQRILKRSLDREGALGIRSGWKSTDSIRLQSLRHLGKGSSLDLSRPASIDLDESEETVSSKRQLFAAMGASHRQRNRHDMEASNDIVDFFAGTDDFDGEKNETHQLNELNRMMQGSGPIMLLRRIVVALLLATGILVTLFSFSVSQDSEIETKPWLYTSLIVALIVITVMLQLRYNFLVERRQKLVLRQAINATAIVSSLFPEGVHDRLLETTSMGFPAIAESDDDSSDSSHKSGKEQKSPKPLLMKLLRDTTGNNDHMELKSVVAMESKPIADFFPHCTVMFSDIVGFTAWSSARQPTDVFTLLESIYKEFDKAARKRRVFKVETIGDCYVAVTGLPEVQDDHAVLMAGFALECHKLMRDVCRKLETSLGPDTGNLCMRTGLHSGPVTAGVLRGEKSRFQLFGDTVNTAARMESNGERNRIHISQKTADLLRDAGKGEWLTTRSDKVDCKGKGKMQTYWFGAKTTKQESAPMTVAMAFHEFTGIEPTVDVETKLRSDVNSLHTRIRLNHQESMIWGGDDQNGSIGDTSPSTSIRHDSGAMTRLLAWNCNILLRLTKQIVSNRDITRNSVPYPTTDASEPVEVSADLSILHDVREVLSFPLNLQKTTDSRTVVLEEKVEKQMRDFVRSISALYRPNSFHNYEHACHVQMSMLKLLERIMIAERTESEEKQASFCTGSLVSDPLVQFALVLCGLIKDVDHTGVPNTQLVKEGAAIALVYNGKSVAEQNAFDLGWNIFMEPAYSDFRNCICGDPAELVRLRQLVINIVIVSDVFDIDLRETQTKSWNLAFVDTSNAEPQLDIDNRRATVVLHDLMQASDIAHTMQDYDVYVRWSKRLFKETEEAYKSGRTDSDPNLSWYQDELNFFDDYVIPLAERLKACGIFGVASDECLHLAVENRVRWELEGKHFLDQEAD